MKLRTQLTAVFSVISLLLSSVETKAEIRKTPLDSTCCPPDSLKFVSINCPVFCVSWRVPSDSSCKTPIGFELQWKLLGGSVWNNKTVTYTSGTTITACDTVAGAGVHVWRVRTICNDSTYSEWVNGIKFTSSCMGDFNRTKDFLISPNPATSSIVISMTLNTLGPVKVSILNLMGESMLERVLYNHDGKIIEQIPIHDWPTGIYFVTISADGVVLRREKIIKN